MTRRIIAALLALLVLLAISRPEPPSSGASSCRPLKKRTWLSRTLITEYWVAPESWFVGKMVAVPGLSGRHRIDWLLSASGVVMEGDGQALDGSYVHLESGGRFWVDDRGRRASFSDASRRPAWIGEGYWLDRRHRLTFPLEKGGWSRGRGTRHQQLKTLRFARGMSLPLRPWRSAATDPCLIPRGSRIWVPGLRGQGSWVRASDTGGAIKRRHLDIFRPAPSNPTGGSDPRRTRVLVLPPGTKPKPSDPGGFGGD